MRRSTFVAALVAAVLVVGQAGWLSATDSGKPAGDGSGRSDQNGQTGKPGEHKP